MIRNRNESSQNMGDAFAPAAGRLAAAEDCSQSTALASDRPMDAGAGSERCRRQLCEQLTFCRSCPAFWPAATDADGTFASIPFGQLTTMFRSRGLKVLVQWIIVQAARGSDGLK